MIGRARLQHHAPGGEVKADALIFHRSRSLPKAQGPRLGMKAKA
jgi:hypothetical protein